jgi:hypothetical protein
MPRTPAGGAAGRLARAIGGTDWAGKAKQAAQTLKGEYVAGKAGDEAAPEPIWGTPKEQIASLIALLRAPRPEPSETPAGPEEQRDIDADADEVAEALKGVDWARVRAATSERTGEAAEAMKAMAQQVDWAKVQPVAGQLSSALIAAVASGQLGLGGRLGPTVARAIINQGGLGQQVAGKVATGAARPPDFRGSIEAVSRDT